MGLSKKTFLYSIILAVVMTAFIIGYFVFMLPSLYVDHVMRSNLASVTEIHKGYTRDRDYGSLSVKNPSSTYTLEIPREGSKIFVTGKFFRLAVDVRDTELQEYLNRIKDMLGSHQNSEDAKKRKVFQKEDFADFWDLIKDKLVGSSPFSDNPSISNPPLAFEMEQRGREGAFREEYTRTHVDSDGFTVFEAGVADNDYSYTTYVAFGSTEDAFLFTVLPTMTPQMEEIRPIVAESMPMIIAVVFLLVLLSSRFFSGRIVNPIIRLAGQAEAAAWETTDPSSRLTGSFPAASVFGLNRKDEVGALGHALSELYERLRTSYLALAEKNKVLEEENLRQEVFLRATSHQLKTPIAAALLLVEGMKNRIGKYKDTDFWLPEVKKQLLSMQKIVEDVLYLNYHTSRMQTEDLALESMLEDLLALYKVQLEAKRLQVHLTGKGMICADREVLKKILDNLLSNAVQHTPAEGRIEILITQAPEQTGLPAKPCPALQIILSVKNYGITIPEELLPGIFDPFVTSSGEGAGKGLGLYIASYYSRLSGFRLSVKNGENCVCSLLEFPTKAAEAQGSNRI